MSYLDFIENKENSRALIIVVNLKSFFTGIENI